MNAKILLIAFSAAAITSCSTVYKSGQTPDDVYYSPVKPAYENTDSKRIEDPKKTTVYSYEDRALRMQIYDYRWREFNDDYDYSYNNSPYYYSYYSTNNYGYYYNPYYCSRPLYYPAAYTNVAVNRTPRMVNLNSYRNYNVAVGGNSKTGSGINWVSPSNQYNNSNNSGSRFGNLIRQVITPSQGNNTTNNNSNNNNNNARTYTPPPSNSGSSSSGSSSSGTSVPAGKRQLIYSASSKALYNNAFTLITIELPTKIIGL